MNEKHARLLRYLSKWAPDAPVFQALLHRTLDLSDHRARGKVSRQIKRAIVIAMSRDKRARDAKIAANKDVLEGFSVG